MGTPERILNVPKNSLSLALSSLVLFFFSVLIMPNAGKSQVLAVELSINM